MRQPRKRVLFVEDNEDILFMLTTVLRLAGYDVAAATSPAEGLEIALKRHFDLFILDVIFAEGSGLALCRELRATYPETPAVIYSAGAMAADREAALRAGARAFVPKPNTDELVETLRSILLEG